MRIPHPLHPTFLLLLLHSFTSADSAEIPEADPCTATSPLTGNFFDLRQLIRSPDRTPPHTDWLAKGQDYGSNFTINICAPVLADTSQAAGIAEDSNKNVSAFYEKDGTVYSIGSTSTKPYFRGRKLVLEYTDGSPCPDAPNYRKSTLMSLLCDHELFAKASISFVGHANECAYFFEVRTASACPTAKAQALGPVSVFGIIGAVAAAVYCIGGCMYQRTVMHARGWRQIPHYHAWAGFFGFLWDAINNAWTKLIEYMPLPSSFRSSASGYSRFGSGFGPRTVGGDRVGRTSLEDENRLIDELDEEWED